MNRIPTIQHDAVGANKKCTTSVCVSVYVCMQLYKDLGLKSELITSFLILVYPRYQVSQNVDTGFTKACVLLAMS